MVDSENLAFLIEAGFSESAAKKALESNNDNAAEAMEWLLLHGEDASLTTSDQTTPRTNASNTLKLSTTTHETTADKTSDPVEEQDAAASSASANSLKCEDCGILLKDEDVATLHVRFNF